MKWPLFWCLKPEDQAKLIQYQWAEYGIKLNIPAPPDTSQGDWEIVLSENQEEISKLMRQRPHYKGGV